MDTELDFTEVVSIVTDCGEIALDRVLEDGLLKDFPIIGTAFGILKTGKNFHDVYTIKNIVLFIKELNCHTQDEIDSFKAKYLKFPQFEKISKKLLYSLSNTYEDQKIKWHSKALNALLDSKYNMQKFLRLSMIIDNCFPDYLLELKNMCKNDVISSKKSLIELSALEHLYSIGCLSNIGIDGIDGGDTEDVTINFDNGIRFRISEFGELLLDYIL